MVATTATSVGSSTTPSAAVQVSYERVEVVLSADLMCADPIDTTGTFASSVIETWIDMTDHRARTTVTYPDGSTRDVLAFGSIVHPASLYQRGEARGTTLGCIAPDGEKLVLGFEPAQSSVYSLNLHALLPPDQTDLFGCYDEVATLQPGVTADSRGRISQLWQQVVRGTGTFGIYVPAIEQTTNTYVSPDTHRFIEKASPTPPAGTSIPVRLRGLRPDRRSGAVRAPAVHHRAVSSAIDAGRQPGRCNHLRAR